MDRKTGRTVSLVLVVISSLLFIFSWGFIDRWHNMLVPFTIVPLIMSFVSVYRAGEFSKQLNVVGIICGLIMIWSAYVIDSRIAAMWGMPEPTIALYLAGVCCIASIILARKYSGKYSEYSGYVHTLNIIYPPFQPTATPKIPKSQDLCAACRTYVWGWGEPVGKSLDDQNVPLLEPQGAMVFNMIYPTIADELEESGPKGLNCGCINILRQAVKNYNEWLERQ